MGSVAGSARQPRPKRAAPFLCLQQHGAERRARVHGDLAATQLAFAANPLNLLRVRQPRQTFSLLHQGARALLAAGRETLRALSVAVWHRAGVLLASEEMHQARIIQHCSDCHNTDCWGASTEQAAFLSKRGCPWHHGAAPSSPTLCRAGAVPAPLSVRSFSNREGRAGRVKLRRDGPTAGPSCLLPCLFLPSSWPSQAIFPLLAHSRCWQAVGMPAVQGLALSPHVQGDGVPPLPVRLIPVPAPRGIPLPPSAAGHQCPRSFQSSGEPGNHRARGPVSLPELSFLRYSQASAARCSPRPEQPLPGGSRARAVGHAAAGHPAGTGGPRAQGDCACRSRALRADL